MEAGKEFIDKIESLVDDARTVKIGNLEFSAKQLRPVMYEPDAATLELHSLTAFCDYYKDNKDSLPEGLMAVVDSPSRVRLVGPLSVKTHGRETFAAAINSHTESFDLNRFLDQESFAIKFRSLVKSRDGDDSIYVLSFIGRLSTGASVTLEDDGISQTCGVKKGVSGHYKENEQAKPIVRLSPYRTFREVEQPESEFLLRVRQEGELPKAALFEADGGAWTLEAVRSIKEFITGNCPGLTVLA